MILPRNEQERDQTLHANSAAESGTRHGGEFAEKYHRNKPGLSIANVLATADSLHFSKLYPFKVPAYQNAYCLKFVIDYMRLEGIEVFAFHR
jgi:hypothetical protein